VLIAKLVIPNKDIAAIKANSMPTELKKANAETAWFQRWLLSFLTGDRGKNVGCGMWKNFLTRAFSLRT